MITKEQAETQLAHYLKAEADILTGQQELEVEGQRMVRAKLDDVRKGVTYWSNILSGITGESVVKAKARLLEIAE
ncbi:MAG: hypothetical protein MI755_16350 [Sphingomonadales bacterium]|nr:hypothetical protein [Sphingomonadales bacterium]